MNAAVGELQSKKIVIKELVLVGLAVGSKQDLFSVGRPVNGVFVVIALRKLAQLLGSDVHHENMQPLIVIEARQSFAGIRFVEIARNDHGITTRFRSPFASSG